jgi:hypothetical protein
MSETIIDREFARIHDELYSIRYESYQNALSILAQMDLTLSRLSRIRNPFKRLKLARERRIYAQHLENEVAQLDRMLEEQ